MNNKKGFTLVEILFVLLIISIISILLTTFMVYGQESFNVYARYTRQQEKIQQTFRVIGKDVMECRRITYHYTSPPALDLTYVNFEIPTSAGTINREWRFEDGSLKCNGVESVNGINTSSSALVLTANTLVISVQPEPTNKGKFSGNNINEPITTEFSVKYKELVGVP